MDTYETGGNMKVSQKDIQKFGSISLKYFNHTIVILWKLGLGKLFNYFPIIFGRSLVIGFNSRSANGSSQISVNYFSQGDIIYCTDIWSGQTDWLLNIIANPQIEIWLPDGWFIGKAEIVDDSEERVTMLRKVLDSSGLAASVFTGINTKAMDEEQFMEAAEKYQLLRIRRHSPCTGTDGPGSLAWLWPLITLILLMRSKRKK